MPKDAPMVKGDKFSKSQCHGNELENEIMPCIISYVTTIGSLMYAQVCTRSDIAYAVTVLRRFQSNPRMDHWKAAKKL